ncbi:MAG: dihydroorotate dehydrogenase electron transfer subunit [Candidatus Omnitrophota bacterium]
MKDRTRLLELSVPASFKNARPGQFVHVRIENSCDPLLRRPMSIHDAAPGRLKILYEVVGKGTELLSGKNTKATIDILGPLGRGFDVKRLARFKKIYIVAGGMGVAPLLFLAKKLVHSPRSTVHGRPTVLIGARTKGQLLGVKEFKKLGCSVKLATDDGSRGFKGNVTELLNKILLSTVDRGPSTICACGPRAMLAATAQIARRHHVPAEISLEEFMGCGLGACLGCVVRTTAGYRRICHDGPVFDAQEVLWEA